MLEPLERQHLHLATAVNRLAGVAVLVDEPVGGPRQVVFHVIGRVLRQRTDAHLHRVELLELLGERMRQDSDEAGGEPALRHEDLAVARLLGERLDLARGRDVLGEVEVAGTGVERRLCDRRIDVVDGGGKHRALAGERLGELLGGAHVEQLRLDRRLAREAIEDRLVSIGDQDVVVARMGEQLGDAGADLAGADDQNRVHGRSSRVRGWANRIMLPIAPNSGQGEPLHGGRRSISARQRQRRSRPGAARALRAAPPCSLSRVSRVGARRPARSAAAP